MATPAMSPGSTLVNFSRNLPYRSGAAGITIGGTNDPLVLQAISADRPFPPGDIDLAKASVTASASSDIVFDSGKGSVGFSANGGGFASLGLYQDPSAAVAAMQLVDDISKGFTLPTASNKRWLVLRWGYDATASANGTIALQGASAQFHTDASSHGKFSIFNFIPTDAPALQAIGRLLDSWVLPSRVTTATDLEEGTCIIAEVDGQVAANIGLTYGYNFNWIREAQYAGLTGSIGLKVELGVTATLGFSLAGSYVLVLSREGSAPRLRVRLFKQRKQGVSFALDAGAAITPSTGTFLPGTFDQFVAGVLGIDSRQLTKDLAAIANWAGGKAPLSGLLSGVSPDYVSALITKVTGIDAVAKFEDARQKLLNFLDTWNGLDSKLAALISSYVKGDPQLLNQIREIAKQFAGASTTADYASLVNLLVKGDFLSTAAGKWLETVTLSAILNPIQDSAAFQKVKEAAGLTATLLDGGTAEGSVLKQLRDFIDSRIGLDQIKKVVDEASFNNLDEWMKAKIGAFLDQTVSSLSQVKTVQRTIDLVLSKSQAFYDEAVKVLNDKYMFSLTALYEKNISDQALADVEFDFNSGLNPSAALQNAIAGRFDDLFFKTTPGVTVHSAAMSHGLQRHSHIDLKLPLYSGSVDHMNQSIARISAGNGIVGADGSLSVFDLQASDTVTKISNNAASQSVLAIAGLIPPEKGNAVYNFGSSDGLTYHYSWRQARAKLNLPQLRYQVRQYIDEYVGEAFSVTGFDTWIERLFNAQGQALIQNPGPMLLSLDLSLPAYVMSGWLKAQASERWMPYMTMSTNVQQAMKRIVPFYYFSDPSKYKDIDSAYLLLAYAAMPTSTSATLDANSSLHLNTNKEVYWDWMDTDLRNAMLHCSLAQAKLQAKLPFIYTRLQATYPETAKFYAPGNDTVRNILSAAGTSFGQDLLRGLLSTEAAIVRGCLAAGQSMAKFVAAENSNIKAAIKALTDFGSNIAETFNGKISSVYGGDGLRPLSAAVYLIAAREFYEKPVEPSTLFELIVLRPGSRFVLADFIKGVRPTRQDVLLDQTITNA
ncbi:MAG TPA: hypothetical protein VKZ53_09440 [Candidatus Angelobacter sp.]|nr:hypothetical protein [Candidatus Angelobacter sp.]